MKSIKMPKNAIFRDELFGSSSYIKDEIWSNMGSLNVLDVFCTISECATTSTSEFIKIQILIILDFFSRIRQFDGRNLDKDFYGMSSC